MSTPLIDLEDLWKEYENFENGTNKILAEKMFKKYSPLYTKSRNALYELKGVYEELKKGMLAVDPRSNFEETHQVKYFKFFKFLNFIYIYILFYFILFDLILFYFVLFYFVLFYFILFYFILFF